MFDLLLFTGLGLNFLGIHFLSSGGSLWTLPLMIVGGFVWTILEYLIHRAGHDVPGLRKHHMGHHRKPLDPVGPASWVTWSLFVACAIILNAVFGPGSLALMSGMAWKYADYVWLHHRFHFRVEGIRPGSRAHKLFVHHSEHHRGKKRRIGVSTTLWDRLL